MPNFTKTLNLEKPLREEFYTIDKHNENSDKIDLAIEKITVPTIEHLKNMIELQEGDIVDIQGYYTAGDGAHHKRKIGSADDGSGVQLANGLWANIVHNGEVNVSWFGAKGDGVTDDTETLQCAINFSKRIVFENRKRYKINVQANSLEIMEVNVPTGILIPSNKTIDFSSSEIFAEKISSDFYNIIAIVDSENIVLKNLKIKGDKKTHITTPTNSPDFNIDGYSGEWGYGLLFSNSRNITIDNIEVSDCWGDGIHFSRKTSDKTDATIEEINKNIRIENINIYGNRRQGISIIEGENIIVSKGVISDTYGTLPGAPIDIEPDAYKAIGVRNVICTDINFENNYRPTPLVFFPDFDYKIKREGIIFKNCTVNSCVFELVDSSYSKERYFNPCVDFQDIKESLRLEDILNWNRLFKNKVHYDYFIDRHLAEDSPKIGGGQGYYVNVKTAGGYVDLEEGGKIVTVNNMEGDTFFKFKKQNAQWSDWSINVSMEENDVVKNGSRSSLVSYDTGKRRLVVVGEDYDNAEPVLKTDIYRIIRDPNVNVTNLIDYIAQEKSEIGTGSFKFILQTPIGTPFTIGCVHVELAGAYNVNDYNLKGTNMTVTSINGEKASRSLIDNTNWGEWIKISTGQYNALDTPYYTLKMQEQGIYEDFITYMDEQHEYEQLQREVEEKRQEAYQLALTENAELTYGEWLSGQPQLMPVVEPQPSQTLLDFKKKYLG